MLNCLVPRGVDEEVIAPLRAALPAGCRVLIERRTRLRRSAHDRRAESASTSRDRRRVRNSAGRRVADRRAHGRPAHAPPLPAELAALDLVFVVVEPRTQVELDDADSGRLVVRVQAGDREAFGKLYLRYFDGIYGYLRTALRDPHEAEDAAQDVFMQALRAIERYELRGQPPRRWLFRIARNQAIDRTRRRRTTPEDPVTLESRLDADPGDAFDGVLSDAGLVALIERLPASQREVLFLRYAAGFEATEIAAMTKRSPAAVRQLHHRAIAELRRRMPASSAALAA
jgi:RNA polymerase sigma-70 factor, ECF subfamily